MPVRRRLAVGSLLAMVMAACTNAPPAPSPSGVPTTATPGQTAGGSATPGVTATGQPTTGPTTGPTASPTTSSPPSADGTRTVTGSLTYTNVFFTLGVAEPLVILEDQAGFVDRNTDFLIPVESQVIGQITSDFFSSPFSYSLTLPAEPRGSLRDVDHDDGPDTGVMVFAVAYWTNTWGDPYLEIRDQGGGGWSTAYASTRVSAERDSYREVTGGKYVVWAPDESQQFPSGFGADARLFTADDPLMELPAGWSVVDMDQAPFAIDRSESPVIDLLEPESAALDDFSGMSYTAAFDAMIEKFSTEYAFTEFKNIDWAAKAAEFRPRFAAAEEGRDQHAYTIALRDFTWSIPDSHIGSDADLQQDFLAATYGGLGMAIVETDDGRFIVDYVTQGGPAAQAGIEVGAEILNVDGQATGALVDATVPWSGPFSNPEVRRVNQVAYAIRFSPTRPPVPVEFANPGDQPQTANVTLAREYDSLSHALDTGASPTDLPVEYDVLPSGLGYLAINSFGDNDLLSIQVLERAIRYFKENQVPGLVIDMRHNNGGSGWLATQMAGYFFGEQMEVGNTLRYDKASGQFFADPDSAQTMYPPDESLQYDGEVAVMVGPGCISACEFFSYYMTLEDRAQVVGQHPTAGAGGSVEQFLMPANIHVQMTIGRAVDANGNIHIEGAGIVPTVRVPVTEANLQAEREGRDVVLIAAENAVAGAINQP